MVKGTTKSGFKFEIDERVIRDKGFLDVLIKAKKATDEMEMFEVTNELYEFVLKGKGLAALEKHIRKNNDGFCDAEVLANEFNEILSSVSAAKK